MGSAILPKRPETECKGGHVSLSNFSYGFVVEIALSRLLILRRNVDEASLKDGIEEEERERTRKGERDGGWGRDFSWSESRRNGNFCVELPR